jgi:hypothetical protein
MINRTLRVLGLLLLIFVPGMALIYVVGSYVACAFVGSCYEKLGALGVLKSVSLTAILVKGGLLAAVFTLLSWKKIRES